MGTSIHIAWAHPEGKGEAWAIMQVLFLGVLVPRHCMENQRDLFLLVKPATSSFLSCWPVALTTPQASPMLTKILKRSSWLLLGGSRAEGALDET